MEVFLDESTLDRQDGLSTKDESIVTNDSRKLTIYSWGRNVCSSPQCDVTFDLVHFRSEYQKRDICKSDGTDPMIQERMRSHSHYEALMAIVVRTIEKNQPSTVSFACSWGKHRSVAFAELLRSEYYPRARVKHLELTATQASDRNSRHNRKHQRRHKEAKMAFYHEDFS